MRLQALIIPREAKKRRKWEGKIPLNWKWAEKMQGKDEQQKCQGKTWDKNTDRVSLEIHN